MLGGLNVRILGESDGKGGGDGPVVVLLHGFGAPGDDLVSLARAIDAPAGTRFVFPEAPIDLGGGRAWWLIDIAKLERMMARGEARDMAAETPNGLAPARAKALAMVDEVCRELAPSQLFLGGFSQGAMLACDVALHTDRKLDGLVMLSGTLISEKEWQPLMPKRKGLRVFMSHGSDDPILPKSAAERLKDALLAVGMTVQWIPFEGGHEIPPVVLDGLGAFLRGAN